MDNNSMACVVIPIYKSYLNSTEKISFNQLLYVLGHHDIIIIAPAQLALPKEIAISLTKCNIKIMYFENKYFTSIAAYNMLMLSKAFYEYFMDYEYMLIYQLDAFVFKDALAYFCSLGYDYIGAPWTTGMLANGIYGRKVVYVGNGGLSLRKVKSTFELLKKCGNIEDYYEQNEDMFFAASESNDYKVASLNDALKFSFEAQVQFCYEKNGSQLPFGCHAWQKFNAKFWKPYIEACGHDLNGISLDGHLDENCFIMSENDKLCFEYYSGDGNDAIKQNIKRQVIEMSKENAKIYIWGAGLIGCRLAKLMVDCGIRLRGLIDNDEKKKKNNYCGINVYGCDDLCLDDVKIIVTVCRGREDVTFFLKGKGMHYGRDFWYMEDFNEQVLKKMY